jgi:hypothetical protein
MTSTNSNTGDDFWQQHIAQWQASGLSQAGYCRQHELTAHQFSYWKCKFLTMSETVGPKPANGFARVQMVAKPPARFDQELSLFFRGGIQVTGITQNNMALLKQLIEVLR